MDMIADILLALGALGAAIYCVVLAGRLKRFNNLQNGVGGAVAVLSIQVDDLTKTLDNAQKAAIHSATTLTALTERAEDVSRRLELMLASMHDLPDHQQPTEQQSPEGRTEGLKVSPISEPEPAVQKEKPLAEVFFSSTRPRVLEAAE